MSVNSGALWKYGIMVHDALPMSIVVASVLLYRDRTPFLLRSGNHLLLRQP